MATDPAPLPAKESIFARKPAFCREIPTGAAGRNCAKRILPLYNRRSLWAVRFLFLEQDMTIGRKLKIALVIFLVFFSGLALLPNFYSGLPEWWTKYCAPAGINLGLDLKGGLHVVLRVDRAKALENMLDFAATDFKNLLL